MFPCLILYGMCTTVLAAHLLSIILHIRKWLGGLKRGAARLLQISVCTKVYNKVLAVMRDAGKWRV